MRKDSPRRSRRDCGGRARLSRRGRPARLGRRVTSGEGDAAHRCGAQADRGRPVDHRPGRVPRFVKSLADNDHARDFGAKRSRIPDRGRDRGPPIGLPLTLEGGAGRLELAARSRSRQRVPERSPTGRRIAFANDQNNTPVASPPRDQSLIDQPARRSQSPFHTSYWCHAHAGRSSGLRRQPFHVTPPFVSMKQRCVLTDGRCIWVWNLAWVGVVEAVLMFLWPPRREDRAKLDASLARRMSQEGGRAATGIVRNH